MPPFIIIPIIPLVSIPTYPVLGLSVEGAGAELQSLLL